MNSHLNITAIEEFEAILNNNIAVLFYFSTTSCSVGENLEPKVNQLIKNDFPEVSYYTIDMNFSTLIAAQYRVFLEPTILVFFEGKETIRKSRNFSLMELEELINRPYQLIFK